MNRAGWVPIGFASHGGDAVVDWCRLGEARFTQPFFDATIDLALRRPFNALFTHRTSIGALGSWYRESPGLAPSGFVFHMSRCGSTLVSQMLAALPANVAISEALPLDRLACADRIPEPQRAEWLRWMVSALGQQRSGHEARCFVKFAASTVAALPFIRRAFPSVPWIFLYRDPEEVLNSHLREPAPATSPGFVSGPRLLDASLPEILAMPPEEYAARVLGRICACARQGLDDRGLLVNYTQLPEAVESDIARHFGVAFAPEESARMREAAPFNAKHPRQRFEADGENKRRDLSESARAAAAHWMQPEYDELERLRIRPKARFSVLPPAPASDG